MLVVQSRRGTDFHFIGMSLVESNTPDNEFWVIGIERGNSWISLPRSREVIKEGDRLVVYCEIDVLRQVFKVEQAH